MPAAGLWFTNWHSETTYQFVRCTPVFSQQSPYQRIEIVDSERFGRVLLLDGEIQFAEGYDACMIESFGHMALLSHPNPETVLIIGGGSCRSLREALKHPSVKSITLVELDGAVIDACRRFLPDIDQFLNDPRVRVVLADGQTFVHEAHAESYDIIIVDMADPVGAAAAIFGREFCTLVARALRPGGVITAHCESPDSAGDLFYRIIATYKSVFAHVTPFRVWIPPFADFWGRLIASDSVQPKLLDEQMVHQRIMERGIELRWLTAELFTAMFRSLSQDVLNRLGQDWPPIDNTGVSYRMI